VWKNSTGLHRALTSTPSNTFGMIWERRLRARPNHPISALASLMLYGWIEASPHSNVPTSGGKPSEKSGAEKWRTNFILMPMILEWYVRQAGVHKKCWSCSVSQRHYVHEKVCSTFHKKLCSTKSQVSVSHTLSLSLKFVRYLILWRLASLPQMFTNNSAL
jgi:hypothetical protein